MRIKLNKIKYEFFKCFKHEQVDINGLNALLRAENGRGKTSAMDGFYWLHTDKDSSGRKQFKMRPLDGDNQPIKGLVCIVEDELLINGEPHTFRKEQHERIVKKDIVGFTNLYWIDGVPKKEKEFKEYHENLCPEDIFKMLTDLDFFNNDKKNPPTERRRTLVDVAGNIPNPVGFEALIAKLNGGAISLKDYETILKDQKKAYVKERDQINPRIDELQRGLDEFAQNQQGDSEPELIAKRDIAKEKVDVVVGKQNALLETGKKRLKITDDINQLTNERSHRETILKNQSGPLDELLDERAELERVHSDKTVELVGIQGEIATTKRNVEGVQNSIEAKQLALTSIRDEYHKADEPNCSLCGQAWPADKPKPGLADIEARGNCAKEDIELFKEDRTVLEDRLNQLLAQEKAKVEELKAAEIEKNKRIVEINQLIENRPEADPSTDSEWKRLTAEIEKLVAERGEPVVTQLEGIEAEKGLAETLLNELNKCLNKFDTNEKARTRIIELEDSNKELTQKIADAEKELDEIDRFKIAESKMVTAKVNGMFKHVTWKLFEYYLNGEIKEICECVLDGVPYGDMSFGQKIYAGIDVINTLSDNYGVEVPLFIDHAESMTLPIEAQSQVIRLYAEEGVKELVVEVEQEKAGRAVA